MRTKLNHWFLIAGMLFIGCTQGAQVKSISPAHEQVKAISIALSQDAIGRIEIIQIPPEVLTRARITPEMLERQYHFKLTIRNVSASSRNRLIETFKSTTVQPRDDTADLRWGVIFYSRNEVRVGAVFFDKTGRHGAVNDAPVSFGGDFFRWLDATFSSCFQ